MPISTNDIESKIFVKTDDTDMDKVYNLVEILCLPESVRTVIPMERFHKLWKKNGMELTTRDIFTIQSFKSNLVMLDSFVKSRIFLATGRKISNLVVIQSIQQTQYYDNKKARMKGMETITKEFKSQLLPDTDLPVIMTYSIIPQKTKHFATELKDAVKRLD
jgi:hypothetical protein